jgi:hypothetical protein
MVRSHRLVVSLFAQSVIGLASFAADAPKPTGPSDSVTFVNGEQISGQLLKVADGKVFFHSEMVGDVSFEWSKVKELKTAKPFAIIVKGDKLVKHKGKKVPEGTLEVSDNRIAITGAAAGPVPTEQISYVVDQPTYDKQFDHHPGWTEGWAGAVTAGLSLVEATQHNTNFTSTIALVRKSPPVDWMTTRSRTSLDFSNSYGRLNAAWFARRQNQHLPRRCRAGRVSERAPLCIRPCLLRS